MVVNDKNYLRLVSTLMKRYIYNIISNLINFKPEIIYSDQNIVHVHNYC